MYSRVRLHASSALQAGTNLPNTVCGLQYLCEHKEAAPALAIILLGTNDAAHPEGSHSDKSVPVRAYADNLKSMIAKLKARKCAHVILVVPPPVSEAHMRRWQCEQAASWRPRPGDITRPLYHTMELTEKYAAACREVRAQLPEYSQ